jgi:fatty-acid desaturase
MDTLNEKSDPFVFPQISACDRSWLYVAPGKWPTFLWILGIHMTAAAGLAVLPLPSWRLFLGMVALALMGGLGTTVCYHRSLSHRAVKLHPLIENILIFAACFNGSSHPIGWVASHRLHHSYSDKPGDVSSPHGGGFWWSHLRWLWQTDRPDRTRWCPDLDRPSYRFWERATVPVLAVSFLFGLLFDPVAWLWLGPVRLVWVLHAQCSINSISHMGSSCKFGDYSQNVTWLTPFILGIGENWHFNHHRAPGQARIGHGQQIDLGWWAIRVLQHFRLAERRPKKSRPVGSLCTREHGAIFQ